jgi:hypothetical protein
MALTMPIVRKVIPCGTSRKARKSFKACSLSALWDGGRDNDLCQLDSGLLPYDMPIDAYTLEVFETLHIRDRVARNSVSGSHLLFPFSPEQCLDSRVNRDVRNTVQRMQSNSTPI